MSTPINDNLSLNLSEKKANDLESDFRMEIVTSSLIEQGYDPERIQIIRDGMARRGYSKDVEDVYMRYSDDDLLEYLYIKTNREGIYDMLPEGLFHQPIKKATTKDKEDVLEEIRIHRSEEFFARKFFQPFEQIADKMVITAYLYEAKYDRKISNPEYVNMFVHYWPVLKQLEHKQAVFFMHIIPFLHKIRINLNSVEEAISSILDVPVQIIPVQILEKKTERNFESSIGGSKMGVDLVLGNSFDDGESDLKIIIGYISANRMRFFLETAKDYKILEELCRIFLPADKFIVKEFKIDSADSGFILSDENSNTFLGINSFI